MVCLTTLLIACAGVGTRSVRRTHGRRCWAPSRGSWNCWRIKRLSRCACLFAAVIVTPYTSHSPPCRRCTVGTRNRSSRRIGRRQSGEIVLQLSFYGWDWQSNTSNSLSSSSSSYFRVCVLLSFHCQTAYGTFMSGDDADIDKLDQVTAIFLWCIILFWIVLVFFLVFPSRSKKTFVSAIMC